MTFSASNLQKRISTFLRGIILSTKVLFIYRRKKTEACNSFLNKNLKTKCRDHDKSFIKKKIRTHFLELQPPNIRVLLLVLLQKAFFSNTPGHGMFETDSYVQFL